MARKTVKERTANVKINPNYDATCKDFIEIWQLNEPYEVLCTAFRFGYLQGAKAAKKELGGAKA